MQTWHCAWRDLNNYFLMKYICDIEALFLANKSSDKDISFKCLTVFESYKN